MAKADKDLQRMLTTRLITEYPTNNNNYEGKQNVSGSTFTIPVQNESTGKRR